MVNRKYILFFSVLLLSACTDRLLDAFNADAEDSEGMAFTLNVREQKDMAYDYGSTRAATGDSEELANELFGARSLSGESQGIQLYTLPLPVMGIHPGTVGQGDHNSTALTSRATAADIVSAGSSPLNFHDSLTIWGYTNTGYQLYKQNLVKKIQGWRTSIHWPYGQGETMRFYAVSPSLENVDILVDNSNTVGYSEAPQLTYKVPDVPSKDGIDQRDLLFGMSQEISIAAGPPGKNGDGQGEYESTGTTEKEQHLGDDDKKINLDFQHLLTAIRFAQGKIPVGVHIKQIKLENIKNQGTYLPDDDDDVLMPWQVVADKGRWNVESATEGNYTLTTDWTSEQYQYTASVNPDNSSEHVYKNAGENVYIDGGQILFLMPHNITAAAELLVTCDVKIYKRDANGDLLTDGSGHYIVQKTCSNITLKASLQGCRWKKGYTITYYLSVGKVSEGYYLLAEPVAATSNTHESSDVPVSGSFTIHSYRNYLDYSDKEAGTDVFTAVPWEVTGFSDAEDGTYAPANCPAWLTSISGFAMEPAKSPIPVNGSGTGMSQHVSYQLKKQEIVASKSHTTILDANPTVSNFDLSNKIPDGTSSGTSRSSQETANCYIVNAKGSYTFPTVYGNVIGSGSSLLSDSRFKDHEGNTITSAYIFTQTSHTIYADKDVTSEVVSATDQTAGWRAKQTLETFYVTGPKRTYAGLGENETAKDPIVELLWQDYASQMFSSMAYSEGNYITFTVANPAPCNAVIALKGYKATVTTTTKYKTIYAEGESAAVTTTPSVSDTPDILWTWHIWVTDEVYPNSTSADVDLETNYPSYANGSKLVALKNADGSNAGISLMPVNLGWVPADDSFGKVEQRNIWVEIAQTQPSGDKQKIHLCIHQDAVQELITGTSTVYQWGRPTALPTVKTVAGDDRTIYNNASSPVAMSDGNFSNAAGSFMHDFLQHPTSLMYNLASSNAWWNLANGEPAYWADGTKTLYDPCPPDFQMPPNTLFRFFSKKGAGDNLISNTEANQLNLWGDNCCAEGKGAYIYARPKETNRYGQTVFIPSSGYWNGNAAGLMKRHYQEALSSYLWTTGKGVCVLMKPVCNQYTHDAFKYDLVLPYSTAMPVRPMKTE